MSPSQREILERMQDPPPEPKWGWRRFYTFLVTVVGLGLVGWIIHKIAPGVPGAGIAYGLIGLVGWIGTLYLVGPSADEVARIFAQGARLVATVPYLMRSGRGGGFSDYSAPYQNPGYSDVGHAAGAEGGARFEPEFDGPAGGAAGDGRITD